MSASKIYYAKPSITELEVRYASDAVTNGWGDTCYAYIERFEKCFSAHVGTRFAHATSSATGALHLGMAALGIGPGDEVILADINWVASVAPVVHLGATPVFVDIKHDTWCLDPAKVREAITPRTKAILAVHLYGNLCDMGALELIAQEYGIYVIEDAAEAIGSHWNGRQAGSRGVFGAFSFHGTKTITTGEGGMLVTNDPALSEKVAMLNNHGRKQGDSRQFWATEVGYKYKISNVQAAIGCAQVERIGELIQRRREIFFQYKSLLEGLPCTMNPTPYRDEEYGYWMPTVVFSAESGMTTKKMLHYFTNNNIDGRAFFVPLSSQAHFSQVVTPIGSEICLRAINLPAYHDMTLANIVSVCNIIKTELGDEEYIFC